MNTEQRFMAAAIRLARRNEGLTGTNPSVACVLVRDDGNGPSIVGSGVTAIGGRPHAEPLALAVAGELAKGATAYVTLEPCAHHGRTPPCAQTLIDAGVVRVVTAVVDPDERVNSAGHAMLRSAGIEIVENCLAEEARIGLAAYLNRKINNRAYVTLKLALSADHKLGIEGSGQLPITGPLAWRQTQLMRARHHAILVGAGTVIEDDPELTCRLPGLENRSPVRIVLDPNGRTTIGSKLYQSARKVRTILVAPHTIDPARRCELEALGVEILPCEISRGRVALPELLEDLASVGILSVMVEGGAAIARSFLSEKLVDELVLFQGKQVVGEADGKTVSAPAQALAATNNAVVIETLALGDDTMTRYKLA
jgi:diaminohydroxyphosphoribosylaminopyrimidine deaminase/5-amino-6-(5-phosphoribosylamino)uracil reductase